jgi:hypothetical protein
VTDEKMSNTKRLTETEEAFAELMETVDQRLAGEGRAIPHRQLHAVRVIGSEFSLPLPFTPPIPGFEHPSFQYWSITQRIYQWYQRRYGDRLKTDFSPGRIVFMMRGDRWVIRLPRIYGRVRFVPSRAPKSIKSNEIRTDGREIIFNILDSVENLPDGLRQSLTDAEINMLCNCFLRGYQAVTALEELASVELVGAARSDISASVDQIAGSHGNFAPSKWSSLQAAEKIIKAAIEATGNNYRRIHDLDALVQDAKNSGVDLGIDDLLTPLRCTPSIRYGQETVNAADAIAAHEASLSIAIRLSPLIAGATTRKSPWSAVTAKPA